MFSRQELELPHDWESNSKLSRFERIRRGAKIGIILGVGLPSIVLLATIARNPKEAAQGFAQDPKEFIETIAFFFSIHAIFVTAACAGVDGYILPMLDKILKHITKMV